MRILKFGAFIFLLIMLGFVTKRNPDYQGIRTSLTTNTHSAQFATSAEALHFLERYLDLPSPVENVAYHIMYYDNSQGLPGPSDWDLKVAVKVLPENIKFWLAGVNASAPFEVDWGYDLTAIKDWTPLSEPDFYAGTGEWLAVFPEGVIFYWRSTLIN